MLVIYLHWPRTRLTIEVYWIASSTITTQISHALGDSWLPHSFKCCMCREKNQDSHVLFVLFSFESQASFDSKSWRVPNSVTRYIVRWDILWTFCFISRRGLWIWWWYHIIVISKVSFYRIPHTAILGFLLIIIENLKFCDKISSSSEFYSVAIVDHCKLSGKSMKNIAAVGLATHILHETIYIISSYVLTDVYPRRHDFLNKYLPDHGRALLCDVSFTWSRPFHQFDAASLSISRSSRTLLRVDDGLARLIFKWCFVLFVYAISSSYTFFSFLPRHLFMNLLNHVRGPSHSAYSLSIGPSPFLFVLFIHRPSKSRTTIYYCLDNVNGNISDLFLDLRVISIWCLWMFSFAGVSKLILYLMGRFSTRPSHLRRSVYIWTYFSIHHGLFLACQ